MKTQPTWTLVIIIALLAFGVGRYVGQQRIVREVERMLGPVTWTCPSCSPTWEGTP